MRIAFLCSGLEPGSDGVGDYTRCLAMTLAELGHVTACAAVRDNRAARKFNFAAGAEARWQDVFENPVEARALAAWLHDFRPDWVSVQYTPFGFHPRGLGGPQAAQLRELAPPTARRHLMLHEIWLQPGSDGAFRHRFLGLFQKFAVDAWTGTGWQPHVVHTQARLHRARLRARGAKAGLLPLFASFKSPDTSLAAAREAVAEWLRSQNRPALPGGESSLWIGHFGAFHVDGWDWPQFATVVARLAANQNRRACFLSLGKARAAQAAWDKAARRVAGADFFVLGKIPQEIVPLALNACDCAFTSTPWDVVEKSGAVAAWRTLGLPVLVARAGATPPGDLPPWPDSGLFLAASAPIVLPQPGERIPGPAFLEPAIVAQEFLARLEAASAPSA